jgi:hypothetical protein
MAQYFFHAAVLWGMACEARDRAAVIAQQPDAMPTDVTVSIILSAASAEGFINEIAEQCQCRAHHTDLRPRNFRFICMAG